MSQEELRRRDGAWMPGARINGCGCANFADRRLNPAVHFDAQAAEQQERAQIAVAQASAARQGLSGGAPAN